MNIQISDQTFARLQTLARPLVDSVDDVIQRLLDLHDKKKGVQDMSESKPDWRPAAAASSGEELRGFQRELWQHVIETMPTKRFTLQDVYARKGPLVELRPHVQEIEASIRAGLEKLRDKGLIEFVDNRGTYRRLVGV